LLIVSFLSFPGLARRLLPPIRRRLLLWLIERDEESDIAAVQKPRSPAAPRSMTRSERLVAQRAHG
jgi:hypothetical protein